MKIIVMNEQFTKGNFAIAYLQPAYLYLLRGSTFHARALFYYGVCRGLLRCNVGIWVENQLPTE